MQNSRYLYADGGLSSLKEARDLLHKHAPKGEHLAYINPQEAALLKAHGGSGEMTESGIRSYGLLKKIFKPVAKVLDKIIPNEIKPALPFLAAAAPFLAPGLIGGIGGLFTTNPALAGAIGSGVLNVGAQASQEGAAKRGLNLGSLALSSLGGALSNPGIEGGMSSSDYFGSLKATGVPTSLTGGTGELLTNSPFGLNVLSGADPNLAYGVSNVLPTVDTSGYTLSNLDKIQNVATSSAQKAAEFIDKGRAGLESEGIFNTDFLKAAAPGQIGAVADKAYAAAQDAKIKYDEQMAQVGQTVAKNKSDQINFIRTAMQKAEFTDSEIEDALKRSGFANGGRVKYADGGDTTLSPYQVELLKLQSSMYDQQRSEENDRRQQQAHEDYIRSLQESTMRSAGFTDEAIQNALATSSYADGGSSNKPQPMPINPELLAVAIFGKRLDELTSTQKNALNDYIDVPKKAKGGLMSLGGHEMDFRAAGGFVPIGKKERADDVPARLSKNEFVFTAKAVRNAGNGDIKKGAKKMYQIMKQLEAKA
jgi:hypothetical protein